MKEMYNKLKIGDLVIESYKTHSEIIEVDSLVLHYLEKWKDNEDRNKKKYNFLLLRDYHLNNCREIYRVDENTFQFNPSFKLKKFKIEGWEEYGYGLFLGDKSICVIQHVHELQHLYTAIMKDHLTFNFINQISLKK